ncbi:Calreticulin-domain-containing protein [Wallemia mellicola]|nr:Calreticulin-domain-containing protein [Wallemia mellicola]TIC08501.1 Calreticulin-domain-containing protein [Wallemia mellicola]
MKTNAAIAIASVAAIAQAATYTPTNIKAPFIEQFDQNWESRWKQPASSRFVVKEPEVYPGIDDDKGLIAIQKAAKYAISSTFDEIVNPAGEKPLVVQYEVKLQEGLECGGAYIKLLSEGFGEDSTMTSDTPYTIMFGPDKCGMTNKVHFILRHKNPLTGEVEEKHLDNPPSIKQSKTTALYTLIVNPDNTYEILINNESVKSGSLFKDFTPPVNPLREIDDPHDTKPADWVDEAVIPDPNATKPDDWDENAPKQIRDPNATKPAGWNEDVEAFIPDPSTEKPAEWDDDEDGEFVAPLVPNPDCDLTVGCGKWEAPLIANPNYRGKWHPDMIVNPDFKGPWSPRKIPNPTYFEDKEPSAITPISGVGFEIWTMSRGILFDNIYVGYSKDDAKAFADETYAIKKPIEEKREREALEATVHDPSESEGFEALAFIRKNLIDFVAKFNADPVLAFKERWDVAGVLGAAIAAFLGLLGTLISIIGGTTAATSAAPNAALKGKQVKKDAPETSDKKDEPSAKATATDAGENNVTKRNLIDLSSSTSPTNVVMTISSKKDRELDVEDYLYLLPEGPNVTKSDINYNSNGKSDYNELGFLKRGVDGAFTSEHKEFYHFVREKTKEVGY